MLEKSRDRRESTDRQVSESTGCTDLWRDGIYSRGSTDPWRGKKLWGIHRRMVDVDVDLDLSRTSTWYLIDGSKRKGGGPG